MAKKKNKKSNDPIGDILGSMAITPEMLAQMIGMAPQRVTVDVVAESAQEAMPEHVSAIWAVRSEQQCCDGDERDGLVITVPSIAQFQNKAAKGDTDPRRAHVVVVGVSEHANETVHMNWDAEMLKKMHNLLPQIIAAAEYQRDEAARKVGS